jgi:hypothetical protein
MEKCETLGLKGFQGFNQYDENLSLICSRTGRIIGQSFPFLMSIPANK